MQNKIQCTQWSMHCCLRNKAYRWYTWDKEVFKRQWEEQWTVKKLKTIIPTVFSTDSQQRNLKWFVTGRTRSGQTAVLKLKFDIRVGETWSTKQQNWDNKTVLEDTWFGFDTENWFSTVSSSSSVNYSTISSLSLHTFFVLSFLALTSPSIGKILLHCRCPT